MLTNAYKSKGITYPQTSFTPYVTYPYKWFLLYRQQDPLASQNSDTVLRVRSTCLVVISLHDELFELHRVPDVVVLLQDVHGQLLHGDVELGVPAESEQAQQVQAHQLVPFKYKSN